MTDPDDGSAIEWDLERDLERDLEWDEVVDVVCVGTAPGVLAYAVCCAANDLDVVLVHPPAAPDEQTAAWYAAMTADLNSTPDRPMFSFARATPPPSPSGKRATLETFIGEDLRQWSAHCLQSPLGVMFTQVPELLVPMRTDSDESITVAFLGDPGDTDLVTWLGECARAKGLADSEDRMAAMLLQDGRIAGVELDGGYRIAATGGLVFSASAEVAGPDLQSQAGCTVALVGRPAGRFATVDLLKQ